MGSRFSGIRPYRSRMLSRHSCADKILSHRLLGIVLSQVPELLALTGLFFREGVLPMSWKRKDSSSISQVRNYYQFLSPGSCLCVMFGHVVNMCVAVSEYENFGACWGCPLDGARAGVRDLCDAWSDNHSKSPTPCFLCQLLGFIPIYYLLLALMRWISRKRESRSGL